jgi:hypothetical protein
VVGLVEQECGIHSDAIGRIHEPAWNRWFDCAELLFPALGRIGRKDVLEVLHEIPDIVFGGIPTAHQAGATASDKLVKVPAQAAQL